MKRVVGWVRDWFGRMPLRVHLVSGLVVLVAVALFGAWFITSKVLENYLFGQMDNRLHTMVVSTARQMQDGNLDRPRPPRFGRPGFRLPGRSLVVLRTPSGSQELTTPSDDGEHRPQLPAMGQLADGSAVTLPSQDGDGPRWRVQVARQGNVEIVAATDQRDLDAAVTDMRIRSLLICLGALVLVAGLGYALVRSSMRPLEEVEQTADVIATGELSRRVPVRRPGSEVGRLANSLNVMLGRIEEAFTARQKSEEAARRSENRMRQFVADASHELRTPLTSIRGYAELYRQGAVTSPAEVSEVLGRIEDQAARMGLLVEDLLLLARLDQQRPLEQRVVDLTVIAVDAVHDARVLDPDRKIGLHLNVTMDPDEEDGSALTVLGDEARLRQVLSNLVNNAITHTPAGTPVDVRLSRRDEEGRPVAVVEVSDQGPGLTGEQSERIFERFYRADAVRSRENGGTGLGLAIVAALVAAHGGRVELDTAPGDGATFRVVLPQEV
ncbi:sensor histidine kinase [Kutzneria kofuensis]|uniref:histidine kinase n=1 Tax=Kutzneria kofuensis TaxID=103725 RepID=A0A7W9KID2_9PSEU|nr:HAMP domain-containing sensor histidine kinase [Kutzneria kofuensis]MBB5893114.1 two-component system OmpR family sensor kinase [Kutzneria kofuensis]